MCNKSHHIQMQQTSQATATLRQQLESELVSVAASADETATKRMHDAEARIQRGVQPELQKNQADTRREVEQTRTAVDDIATRLDQLTTQLNEYRPVQEATVAVQGEKLSSNVETRLQMQSSRLDDFAKSLQEAREEQHSTAETLQTILVSLENLSENFPRLQEEQLQWDNPEQQIEEEEQGRVDQAVLDDLLKEVPLTQSPASETVPVSAVSFPQFSMTILASSFVHHAPVPIIDITADGEGIPVSAVQTNVPVQSMAQTSFGGFKFTGGNFSSDSGSKFNLGAVPSTSYIGLDRHPQRITPIPVSSAQNQPKVPAVPRSPEEVQRDIAESIKKQEMEKAERARVVTQYKSKGCNDDSMLQKTTPDSAVDLINSMEQSGGANRPTIGSTAISSAEAERIKKKMRDCVQQVFPGINLSTDHQVSISK